VELLGIHHLTAVTAQIHDNYQFYTGVLGMRLVKRSVNQDDVSAYHLFYADGAGTPGTDLTFFDWRVPRERHGNHTVSRTGLRVASRETLEWWADRLAHHSSSAKIAMGEIDVRDGKPTLDFEDPEGQRLSLVVDDHQFAFEPWQDGPVPAEHQIRGLGPIQMSVPELAPTELVLTRVLGMRLVREYPHPDDDRQGVHVFEMGSGGAAAELHVAVRPGLPAAGPGAGGVHHVAFRVADDAAQGRWLERLASVGIPNSGIVDRYYFKSLYFREPNGVLFELATDGPGFALDEAPAALGESVALPPFLEPRRREIVANLRPID
jgi:glyoxalase family protein